MERAILDECRLVVVSLGLLKGGEIMPRRPANPNETAEQRFVRLAEARTKEALNRIRILSNCANRQLYHYTPEQVEKIFGRLEDEVRRAREKFEEHTAPPEFKL